jgi:hypothetical protein
MLMCMFVHSRFFENPLIGSWETNPCFFRGVLSHDEPTQTAKDLHKLLEEVDQPIHERTSQSRLSIVA